METVYIVTGARGYVGYSVVEQLREQGKTVRAFASPKKDCSHLEKLGATVYRGDIRKIDTIEPMFEGEDKEFIVIHIAGIVTVETKFNQFVWDINVGGTNNVIDLCKKYKAKKLVHIGSVDAIPPIDGKVYADYEKFDPADVVTVYGKTKAEAIQNVLKSAKEDGLDACVVLPTAVFGPDDYANGMVSQMLSNYAGFWKLPLIPGGYDFVDVRDLAAGIISATENGGKGEVYILCGEYADVITFINEAREIRGYHKIHLLLPKEFAKVAGFLAEKFADLTKSSPVFTAYTIDCINSGVRYSYEKAAKDLGYNPRPRIESVKDMITFMEKEGTIKNTKLHQIRMAVRDILKK